MTTDFPVHIQEYDSSWPARFAEIAGRAQAALGDIVLRVEHIGSTAVPGLAAKLGKAVSAARITEIKQRHFSGKSREPPVRREDQCGSVGDG